MEVYQGVPVWHASAAIQPLRPLRRWTLDEERRARLLLRQVLQGVGQDLDIEDDDRGVALHIRRKVSPAEHRIVGPAMDVRVSPPRICNCAACQAVRR